VKPAGDIIFPHARLQRGPLEAEPGRRAIRPANQSFSSFRSAQSRAAAGMRQGSGRRASPPKNCLDGYHHALRRKQIAEPAGIGARSSSTAVIAIACAQTFGTALAILIGVSIALYAGWRGKTLIQMIRWRVRRMGPAMLDRKLKSKSKVAVLDFSEFEEETDGESLECDSRRLQNSPFPVAELSKTSLFRMMSKVILYTLRAAIP
jgi:hypothetical protein